ncbi:MAG: glutamate racemase [Methylococcaceae bacterium]|nr:glutamate racemase [Methylococcaceae bacterium]
MNAPVGIFDSGLGGLSVVDAIHRLLPEESLLYVADSGHCPYGDKPVEYLQERARVIAEFLLRQGCKALVVACNTATAATVSMLRERHSIPILGLEPAVKPAAAATRSGIIGILATAGTLRSQRYALLLERYAPSLTVLSEACPGWVEAVESLQLEGPETEALVESHVRPLLEGGVDTLVLGCTHYPFLRGPIERIAGPAVAVIDTGEPVARQLKRRLLELGLLTQSSVPPPALSFFTSGDPNRVASFVRRVSPELKHIDRFPA